MKINVTVDLSEMYNEEEDYASIKDTIKDSIKQSVVNEVLNHFKEKLRDEWSAQVRNEIEAQKASLITDTLNEMISTLKIKKAYSGSEMITVKEYMASEIQRMSIDDRKQRDYLDSVVKKTVEDVSKELKNRYDMLFASQIITKMNENGMLKEDVAKILLG